MAGPGLDGDGFMTTTSKQKRLDAVEIALTPKEWGIRLVDQIRKYPTIREWGQAEGHEEDHIINRAYEALHKQAEGKHPGTKPEDVQARVKLTRALNLEFSTLKHLWARVNEDMEKEAKVAALKAALKMARLETTVLSDAFGRTARKAVEWVEEYKPADAVEEENRQGMLKELAAYTDLDFGEKWGDSMPLPGGIKIRFPSVIEDWINEVVALAVDVYGHRAAVQAIQKEHFDGHPILFRNVEADLEGAIVTLEEGVKNFNDYLKTRAELFAAEWSEEEEHEGGATAIPGELEGKLAIDIDAIKASAAKHTADVNVRDWIKYAKMSAKHGTLLASGEVDEANALLEDLWKDLAEKKP